MSIMADEFLPQEEMEILLKGVAGPDVIQQNNLLPSFRPHNLATQERVVRRCW